jgi:flavin reductase (DIM6/NTAB) family NADH-FMN oxidoreductase RutF
MQVYELKPIFNDEGLHTVTVIYGRVKRIHVHEEVLTPGSAAKGKPVVDHTKLEAVGRLGGDTYTVVNNDFDLLRPKV